MNRSDVLFQLVKSMTTAEKRYFSAWAKSQNEKFNYLALFELINKQKEYNHEQVKKFFGANSSSSNISSTKNYLYRLLLKSLRQFNIPGSVKIKLRDMLDEAEILLGKTLYEHVEKILSNAKKIALKHELYPIILQVIELQRKLYLMLPKDNHEELQALLHDERINIFDIMQRNSILMGLKGELFSIVKGNINLPRKDKLEKARLLVEQVNEFKAGLIDFRSQHSFYTAHGMFNKILNQHQECRYWFNKVVELYNTHDNRKKEDMYDYKLALNNYISACFLCNELEGIQDSIKEYKELPVINPREEATLFQSVSILELNYYLSTARSQETLAVLPEIEVKFSMHEEKMKINGRLALAYNIAVCYFINEEFQKAEKWIDWITSSKHPGIREDIQSVARLLQLVIYLEYKDVKKCMSYVNKVRRYKKIMDYETKLEDIVLKRFSKLDGLECEKEQFDWLVGLQGELSLLDPTCKNIVGYEEILYWVESKLHHKPMNDILFEKRGMADNVIK